MTIKRRTFLKRTLATSTVAMAAGAGVLVPRAVLAVWPETAFSASDVSGAITGVVGSDATSDSDQINIKAPDIAENGAVVPVTVTTGLSNVESIAIVASENPTPLTSNFILGSGAEGFVSTRIKMAKTSDVIAVVKANGNLYSMKKEVKVTIGGCGG
ncbi:MAG: thiosulfate oxidation carrier protein SoxY [Gammaproteobacteria bacterium]|nr:thiosulfate oxidation carrier protein SoxY [Gammaproteobacteria bacterium]